MGTALFILSGVVQLAGLIFAGALVDFEDPQHGDLAATLVSVALFLLSAWAFLASAYQSKKFLSEHNVLVTEDFAKTVFWFAVPLANFYVPWKRLATIRNSLGHYLRTGELEEHEGGRGATVILAVLFFIYSLIGRFAGRAPLEDEEALVNAFLAFGGAWLISFSYATFWLWTLAAKRTRAVKQLAEGEPQSPPLVS